MPRSQKKHFRKTISLVIKLALLIILFWGGIHPVFTDLFEEENTGKEEQISEFKDQRRVTVDTLIDKISAFHPVAD